jgi:hypothetical protein
VTSPIVSSRILILFFCARATLAHLGLKAVMALLRHLLAGAADNVG